MFVHCETVTKATLSPNICLLGFSLVQVMVIAKNAVTELMKASSVLQNLKTIFWACGGDGMWVEMVHY